MDLTSPPAPPVPTKEEFYRYASPAHPEWLERLLHSNEIYVPTIAELNDPADAKPSFAVLPAAEIVEFLWRFQRPRNEYERLRLRTGLDTLAIKLGGELLTRELARTLYAQIDERRVFSMSKRPNILPLWAHYAANHSGYCLVFRNVGLFSYAREVVYGVELKFEVTNPAHASFDWYFHKAASWAYEEEVRLAMPKAFGGPYFQIPPEWLSGIILGSRVGAAFKADVKRWVATRPTPIAVSQATFDTGTLELRVL